MGSEEKRESGEVRKPTELSCLLLFCSRRISNLSIAKGGVAEEDCEDDNEEEKGDKERYDNWEEE